MALDVKFTNDLIREIYFKLLLVIVAADSDEAAANSDGPTVDDIFTPIVAKKQKLTIKSSIAQWLGKRLIAQRGKTLIY